MKIVKLTKLLLLYTDEIEITKCTHWANRFESPKKEIP